MTSPVTLFILIGCILASRIMGERALRELTPDQKLRLLDGFASIRAYSYVPLLLIVVVAFGLPRMVPDGRWWFALLALAGYLVFLVAEHIVVARKLDFLELPESYIKQVLRSRHISHVGIVVFLGGVVYRTLIKAAL